MSTVKGLRLLSKFTRNTKTMLNLQRSKHTLPLLATKVNPLEHVKSPQGQITCKFASTSNSSEALEESTIDSVTYERVCSETLNALCDYFEELTENSANIAAGSDVAYGDGVLTVKLGQQYGTYVINRQTPNKQIWLSSPTSGPKRFDFVGSKSAESGKWIYKHTGESIHELLQQEMLKIMKNQKIDFLQLPYGS